MLFLQHVEHEAHIPGPIDRVLRVARRRTQCLHPLRGRSSPPDGVIASRVLKGHHDVAGGRPVLGKVGADFARAPQAMAEQHQRHRSTLRGVGGQVVLDWNGPIARLVLQLREPCLYVLGSCLRRLATLLRRRDRCRKQHQEEARPRLAASIHGSSALTLRKRRRGLACCELDPLPRRSRGGEGLEARRYRRRAGSLMNPLLRAVRGDCQKYCKAVMAAKSCAHGALRARWSVGAQVLG